MEHRKAPLDRDVLDILAAKTQLPGTDHAVMGAILSGLPRTFVMTDPEYVARALEAAQRQGDELRKRATSGFYGSVM